MSADTSSKIWSIITSDSYSTSTLDGDQVYKFNRSDFTFSTVGKSEKMKRWCVYAY